jgi:hypothetical protein
MPKRKVIYVTPTNSGQWRVKREGSQRALKNFENKQDAVDYGRQIARNFDLGQLKIQKRDRKLQTEYTYGHDPFPPKG